MTEIDFGKLARTSSTYKKTEFLYFHGTRPRNSLQQNILIGGEEIRRVEGARFLGVWVDENLKWSAHINKVKTKVSQLVGVIGRIRNSVGGNAVRTLYNGLILPHLQYCLMVWGDFEGGRNVTLGSGFLKLQKRMVGMIEGKRGKYRVIHKKVLHKSEEKMHKKKMAGQKDENLAHEQHQYGICFSKKKCFLSRFMSLI